jgi:hypothetical protein
MSFLRHIGKIGDRKVAIVFREVPGEPHMALVTYTESLNRHLHDPMMACIESDIGQNSQNLADALNRTHTQDGKYILQVLHAEGLLKKVQTSQVVVTPNANTKIKLDELNKILTEMEQGEAAVKKLAEMDASRGIQDPAEVARKMRADKTPPPVGVPNVEGVLGDSALANNLLQQAQRMANEAKGLLAESARLEQQANEMLGIPVTTQTTEPVKRGRGRPPGAKSKAKATV